MRCELLAALGDLLKLVAPAGGDRLQRGALLYQPGPLCILLGRVRSPVLAALSITSTAHDADVDIHVWWHSLLAVVWWPCGLSASQVDGVRVTHPAFASSATCCGVRLLITAPLRS